MANTLIRLPEVSIRTGLKRSTIYDRIQAKSFPAPIRLGGNSVAWIQEEIDTWIANRIASSRNMMEGQ